MKLMVTGSPGVGKTTIAKALGKKLGYKIINEKDFALQNGIGSFNDENELEIPVKEFEKKANQFLSKNKHIIFEGHVLCETKLNVDKVILLRVNPEILEMRLELRKYSSEKIMDNVFIEGIDYCKKHVLRKYPKNKIIEVESKQSINETLKEIINKLKIT
jgi:adenylate kinase